MILIIILGMGNTYGIDGFTQLLVDSYESNNPLSCYGFFSGRRWMVVLFSVLG